MSGPNTSQAPLPGVRLLCPWCGTEREADLNPWCNACGGSLAAIARKSGPEPEAPAAFWDYASRLPAGPSEVSLGEGNTPLLHLDRLFAGDNVYVKAEWQNPTGSFKDRGAALAVSVALDLGAEGIVCASTGNNATSVSAYAARAGLPCIVVVPEATSASKIAHAGAYGPTLLKVPGNFSDAYRQAEEIRTANPSWANLTSTYLNPYMTAAHATIMYELHKQLRGRVGTIIIPIGAGPMLAGILQGAQELLRRGEIASLPVLVGVQSSGCAPIARAFTEGADQVEAWADDAFGITGSINDPLRGYPEDGTRTLRAIRETGGFAVAVSDEQIQKSMAALGRHEGIVGEPTAAATLAALQDILEKHDLPRPIVLVMSGHALKDPTHLASVHGLLEAGDMAPDEIVAAAKANAAHQQDQAVSPHLPE